jgi:hypothetical protein
MTGRARAGQLLSFAFIEERARSQNHTALALAPTLH